MCCLQTKLVQCKLRAVVNMLDIPGVARVGSKIKNRLKRDQIPSISESLHSYHFLHFKSITISYQGSHISSIWTNSENNVKHGRYGWKNTQLEHSSYEWYIVFKKWFSVEWCKIQSTCHFSKITQIWNFFSKWKWQGLYGFQV